MSDARRDSDGIAGRPWIVEEDPEYGTLLIGGSNRKVIATFRDRRDADYLVETVAERDQRWHRLIENVRRRHHREPMAYIAGDHCRECRLPWPCPEAALIEALDGHA